MDVKLRNLLCSLNLLRQYISLLHLLWFFSCVSTLTLDLDKRFTSVHLLFCPSVRHVVALWQLVHIYYHLVGLLFEFFSCVIRVTKFRGNWKAERGFSHLELNQIPRHWRWRSLSIVCSMYHQPSAVLPRCLTSPGHAEVEVVKLRCSLLQTSVAIRHAILLGLGFAEAASSLSTADGVTGARLSRAS